MRKVLVCCILLSGFTACKNAITGVSTLKTKVHSSLWHIFNRVSDDTADSTDDGSVKHFNFFLKDGFANKFGL